MNKTDIEWCDYTWNPVTGCRHGCPYCYARKAAEGPRLRGRFGYPADEPFRPTFHEGRLLEPTRKREPSIIFAVSMGDLFGKWVPKRWIEDVMMVAAEAERHQFLFLTKNPERYHEIESYPDNVWLGASADNRDDFLYVCEALYELQASRGFWLKTFVSLEPFTAHQSWLGAEAGGSIEGAMIGGVDWLIIGGQTKPSVTPAGEAVQAMIECCGRLKVPVFVKDNVRGPNVHQQWPRDMEERYGRKSIPGW